MNQYDDPDSGLFGDDDDQAVNVEAVDKLTGGAYSKRLNATDFAEVWKALAGKGVLKGPPPPETSKSDLLSAISQLEGDEDDDRGGLQPQPEPTPVAMSLRDGPRERLSGQCDPHVMSILAPGWKPPASRTAAHRRLLGG